MSQTLTLMELVEAKRHEVNAHLAHLLEVLDEHVEAVPAAVVPAWRAARRACFELDVVEAARAARLDRDGQPIGPGSDKTPWAEARLGATGREWSVER